jgi:nicotinate-nucleotide adenylyltransferase
MRIGVLGGSFDPVHFGHLRAAEWALEALALDRVFLVPARRSPFKGPGFAPDPDRLAMLRLAAADNPRFEIETCELDREPPSYTVDTLRTLTQRVPGSAFTLILGSDAAVDLEKWREIGEIRRLADLRILARPDEPSRPEALAFEGLSVSSTGIRSAVSAGRSIRYLTPDSVRLYIEEKGLYK